MTTAEKEWLAFARGRWTKRAPTKPGEYPVRDRDGHGNDRFHVANDLCIYIMGDYNHVSTWKGWWWSKPLPRLPMPPPWAKPKE